MVLKVGVDLFNDAMEAQALYFLKKDDWKTWLGKICEFCESGNTKVYAENALNELNGAANIHILDVENMLCSEIDNPEDLAVVSRNLKEIESRTVYMCFASDIIHAGHIRIIKRPFHDLDRKGRVRYSPKVCCTYMSVLNIVQCLEREKRPEPRVCEY